MKVRWAPPTQTDSRLIGRVGIQVRFVVVTEQDGSFNFIAPWGERMVARPGDLVVQDIKNSKDT